MEEMNPASAPKLPKRKMLVTIVVIALIALAVVLDIQRRAAQTQLENLTVQLEQLQGNTQQNQEVAKRIVRQVRRLISIPEDVEPTVATIVDIDTLRGRNPFYEKADNGDYLVVTAERAILYDANENIIIDVVPVQVRQASAPTGDVTAGEEVEE